MAAKIAFILGAGPNIGQHVAKKFAANGYKVAVSSRSGVTTSDDYLGVKADFTDPLTVARAFKQVRDTWGDPSVVVYNASALHLAPTDDAFSIPVAAFQEDLNVNAASLYAAIQETVQGWKNLKASSKTFIFTGNLLNVAGAMPAMLTLGVGKAAAAHLIDGAVKSYGSEGYKFYYADERNPNGSPVGTSPDAKAHSEIYFQLAEDPEQRPWDYTFVKFKGFTKF
ncbi:hypothetical protein V1520DRAFT_174287 [Lipomyces starkeyi]|uniref:Uncharacterized protein n=1 Tax=Lipomyces starkeyi NRRL Y-11557 TaxID=675824 RepID=A0A1E3PXI6_LIPST|nr:hypothetical protein LIPSTDRAFT_192564 [Lipomyces starkeyi NRRL Y-11557]